MKKFVLALGALAMITAVSCGGKKEEKPAENKDSATTATEQPATTAPAENAGDVFTNVPKFSNEETQKFAEEYAVFYKEMLEATKSNNVTKVSELQGKAVEISKKAQEQVAKLTPEDAKLWTEWAQKIAEATTAQVGK